MVFFCCEALCDKASFNSFKRDEILSRIAFALLLNSFIGMRPSSDPKADELVNSNISQPNEGGLNGQNPTTDQSSVEESEEDFIVNDLLNFRFISSTIADTIGSMVLL